MLYRGTVPLFLVSSVGGRIERVERGGSVDLDAEKVCELLEVQFGVTVCIDSSNGGEGLPSIDIGAISSHKFCQVLYVQFPFTKCIYTSEGFLH